MIDTHSHLFVEEFAGDLSLVIDRAKSVGVERVYLPNIDDTTVESLLDVCTKYAADGAYHIAQTFSCPVIFRINHCHAYYGSHHLARWGNKHHSGITARSDLRVCQQHLLPMPLYCFLLV